jgi:hypothetical protein
MRLAHVLKAEFEARGINSKSWTSASGRLIGGKPFSRGALYLILQNRLYHGEIVHKGQSHPSEHPAIIDQPLWDAVQAQLAGNTAERNSGTRTHQPSLLAGMLGRRRGRLPGSPPTGTALRARSASSRTRQRAYTRRADPAIGGPARLGSRLLIGLPQKSSSHWTPRWREMDSNHRYLAKPVIRLSRRL